MGGLTERRRAILMEQPHLATVSSGNTSGSEAVASFNADGLPIKSLIVTVPYTPGGLAGIETVACGRNLCDLTKYSGWTQYLSNGELVGSIKNLYTPYPLWYGFFNASKKLHLTWGLSAYCEGNSTRSGNGIQPYIYFDQRSSNKAQIMHTFPNSTSSWLRKTQSSYASTPQYSPDGIGISYSSAPDNIWHIKDIMIELGDTASAYEPFKGGRYATTFSGTFYGGTIDLIKGEVTSTYDSGGNLLADPVVYSVSPVTIKTLAGLNNIWCDNGLVSVVYWTH